MRPYDAFTPRSAYRAATGRKLSIGHFTDEGGMKLGLINSAWAQAGRDTAWGIEKTKELGFDTIDIFVDPLDMDMRERFN